MQRPTDNQYKLNKDYAKQKLRDLQKHAEEEMNKQFQGFGADMDPASDLQKMRKPPKSSGYGKIPVASKKPTAESLLEEYGVKSQDHQ